MISMFLPRLAPKNGIVAFRSKPEEGEIAAGRLVDVDDFHVPAFSQMLSTTATTSTTTATAS